MARRLAARGRDAGDDHVAGCGGWYGDDARTYQVRAGGFAKRTQPGLDVCSGEDGEGARSIERLKGGWRGYRLRQPFLYGLVFLFGLGHEVDEVVLPDGGV